MKILKLIFKNALRHKLRAFLTILGIAIAVMAFGLLQTVVTAWNSGVEAAAADRLITRQAVSFIFPLPYAYKEQIAKVAEVETVTFFNWFGGIYKDKNQFFARIACDPQTLFEVYPEFVVTPAEREAFLKERNSCVIGADLAKTYNLKLGDIMELEGDIYPGRWQFVVRAIYQPRDQTVDAMGMYFHWQYLDERIRQESPERAGNVGWFAVKIRDARRSAEVSERIDALFMNSRAETKTETERAFQQGFVQSSGAIITSLNVMSFVIIGIIMLVLGNTMIMAARERTREYAVLKTLGFTSGHLSAFVAGESMIISFLGAGLGVILAYVVTAAMGVVVPKGWFPVFILAPSTVVLASCSAIFVGILASIIPLRRALKMRIVDGLRFIG